MKTSQLLATALSTAALAGAVTLAHAQNAPSTPQSADNYNVAQFSGAAPRSGVVGTRYSDERDPRRQASSVNSRIDNYGSNLTMRNDGSNFKDDGFAPGNSAMENTLGR